MGNSAMQPVDIGVVQGKASVPLYLTFSVMICAATSLTAALIRFSREQCRALESTARFRYTCRM